MLQLYVRYPKWEHNIISRRYPDISARAPRVNSPKVAKEFF